ncbi:hypothetical protein [Sedimentisphaera salicampi]|uniref:hypothetical protein n=1 Tax=Sedimentisphaera salicampi TaxID=1941349 RepID=UPI000B9BA6FE|nr:hypothetical protein [Sedimentisphaera salicampi]OXU14767.1 hypothetical protein SMSP1_01456 [Sedimentisphaera salicampi]
MKEDIKQQAEYLAKENYSSEPNMSKILWFPDEREVRLVEILDDAPSFSDNQMRPVYFKESPKDRLYYPSAIVLVNSKDFNNLNLPSDWGSKDEAVELSGD